MSTTNTPRLVLVKPKQSQRHYSDQLDLARLIGRHGIMPPLALATIAAHTPAHWDVRIIDEEVEEIPPDLEADVIGITTQNHTIGRAHELARRLKKRGRRIVFGGPYASYALQDSLLSANAVVVGEAEAIWAQLLSDFEEHTMRRVYQAPHLIALERQRAPRWDLVDTRHYVSLPVQASRGCPCNCDFCLVPRMFGREVRCRPIDAIIAEIEQLPLKRIFFVDDNLTINRAFAHALIERLAPLGISWSCRAGINIADDPVLIERMAAAGCEQVRIEFAAVNPPDIAQTDKKQNQHERSERAIARIHAAGIHVIGSFIIGFDPDTTTRIERIVEFCNQTSLCFVSISILDPSPGTTLHENLARQGRLSKMPNEWRGGMMPVMQYLRMGQRDLLQAFMSNLFALFCYARIAAQAKRLFADGAFVRRPDEPVVGLGRKLMMCWYLLKHFRWSADNDKQELFRCMVGQVRAKRLTIEQAIVFLLSMEGFHDHVERFGRRLFDLYQALDKYDRGPWEKQAPRKVPLTQSFLYPQKYARRR